MEGDEPSARVFISCGQSTSGTERETAHRIAETLRKLGFDPYIAVEEQSLRGIKENIFAQLASSEYFLFVDFRRERLDTNDARQDHRGSLFSHQELAIASYLDIPVLAFQERGVKKGEGILGFVQGNPIEFAQTDRHHLPDLVAQNAQKKGWDPRAKYQLRFRIAEEPYQDVTLTRSEQLARFFYINVWNLHPRKCALKCCVYLDRVRNVAEGIDRTVRTVESKWAGYTHPNANIMPRAFRPFDALMIPHHAPTRAESCVFTGSTPFIQRFDGPGDYELTFAVTADNFRPARGTFKLHIDSVLAKTRFEPLHASQPRVPI